MRERLGELGRCRRGTRAQRSEHADDGRHEGGATSGGSQHPPNVRDLAREANRDAVPAGDACVRSTGRIGPVTACPRGRAWEAGPVRVAILGPLEVEGVDGPVEIRGARLRALLARLALDPGRVVSVEALALALWEDDVPTDVPNAVQSLVSRLRRSLTEPTLLLSRDGGYVLAVGRDDVDAHRFRSWALEGRDALRADDPASAADLLDRALALWRGEALADLRDPPYAAPAVALLEQARAAAVEDRLDAEVRLGRGADVLPALLSLVEDDPLRERTVGLLMRALYDAGRQADALEQFERTRALLSDRLGTDPSPALQAVHLDVLRGSTGSAAESQPTNLRSTLTSFLGRGEELDRVNHLLSTHRLVTLVGPGGAGKTRLALEAAARQRGSGGVWVAELAPVTSPDDIAQAVLDAVDARDVLVLESRRLRPSRDSLTQLEDVLSVAPSLVVLDNCEHLVDAAASLCTHLLTRCPHLRILATSREPLSITGEVLHPVSMLTLPPPGASVEVASRTSSVQLLLDRAAAVAPGFALTPQNVDDVVEVCRRLDGLPLAIELAAARLRGMSVSQLAARLDDRFRLLTGGSRTAVARHRTLRAVVEWSWDLLSADERDVAERFSVFPGGATVEAVARVCLRPEAATPTRRTHSPRCRTSPWCSCSPPTPEARRAIACWRPCASSGPSGSPPRASCWPHGARTGAMRATSSNAWSRRCAPRSRSTPCGCSTPSTTTSWPR